MDEAEENHRRKAPRESAEQRAEDENDDAGEEEAFLSESASEFCGGEEEKENGEKVREHHPLDGLEGARELFEEGGEGDVEYAGIEGVHGDSQADAAQSDPRMGRRSAGRMIHRRGGDFLGFSMMGRSSEVFYLFVRRLFDNRVRERTDFFNIDGDLFARLEPAEGGSSHADTMRSAGEDDSSWEEGGAGT